MPKNKYRYQCVKKRKRHNAASLELARAARLQKQWEEAETVQLSSSDAGSDCEICGGSRKANLDDQAGEPSPIVILKKLKGITFEPSNPSESNTTVAKLEDTNNSQNELAKKPATNVSKDKGKTKKDKTKNKRRTIEKSKEKNPLSIKSVFSDFQSSESTYTNISTNNSEKPHGSIQRLQSLRTQITIDFSKKQKHNTKEATLETAVGMLEDIATKLDTHLPTRLDGFDDFGTYVAAVLRSLPHERAMALQPRIISLINSTEVFKQEDF